MTHAECKEQLFDLIYGELPPERAAEVELHLAGCAECRAERDSLSGTRAAFAPMMSVTDIAESEPGPEFDLPILAAAKEMAAQMAAETARAKAVAKPAPVISLAEVRAAAAAKQAQAPVQVPDSQRVRRKPRWMRATLVGSIAAAAALALIVSTRHTPDIIGVPPRSAEEMQVSEQKGAEARAEREAQAKALNAQLSAPAVAPAQAPAGGTQQTLRGAGGVAQAVPSLAPPATPVVDAPPRTRAADARGALGGLGDGAAGSGSGLAKSVDSTDKLRLDQPAERAPAEPKPQYAPPPPGWANARREKKAKRSERDDLVADDSSEGSAGVASGVGATSGEVAKESSRSRDRVESEKKDVSPTPAKKPAERREEKAEAARDQDVALDSLSSNAPAPAPAAAAPRAVETSLPPPPPAAGPRPVAVASAPPPAKSASAPHFAASSSKSSAASSASPAADDGPGLEAKAAAARASGQLREAGRFYREAAGAFFASSSPEDASRGTVALVNAVTCYARAGDLAEARTVRDLLVSMAPEQTSAIARANAEISAREAPPPSAASAPPASGR